MGTDEDYLDRLLSAVTENYREEQGITEEPEPEVGDKFVSNPEAVLTSKPLIDKEPVPEPVTVERVYEPEQTFVQESVSEPEMNMQEAAAEQTPVFDEQISVDMETGMPSMGEMPVDPGMGMPSMEEVPVDMGMGMPPMEEMPADPGMDMPPMEEVPVDIGMEMPSMEEMPADMGAGMPSMEEMPIDMGIGMPQMDDFMDDGPAGMDILNEIQGLSEEELNVEPEPMSEPAFEPEPASEPEPAFEPEPVAEEPASAPELSDDPNHIMTPEEIAALVGGAAAEEPAPEPEPEPIAEPEPVAEEPASAPELSDDPNHIMTPEEIAALVGGAAIEEPAPEPEPEPIAEPEPAAEEPASAPELSDDPNHIMTPEEIAALVGGAATEEPAPEPEPEPIAEPEPVSEEPASAPELSNDPNHIMTPEEIAALVGGAATEEPAPEPEPEPIAEPEPVSEEPASAPELSDDPNHIMTPEEIAALVGGAAAEEPAPEPEPEPEPAEEDANRMMSPEEIDAMFASAESVASGEAEEPAADGGAKTAKFTLNEVDGDVIPLDFGIDGEETKEEPGTADILGELGLAGADSPDMDVTEIIDDMPGDSELSEINDLLKKNDNSEMVEEDLLAMLQGSEEGEGEDENQENGAGEEPDEDDKKSKKKKRERKKKDKKADKEPELDEEGNPIRKKGLIARIAEFLFAGDDEDDEEGSQITQPAIAEDGTLVANPSEQTLENNEVLKEASADADDKKKKKKKKEKKPKPKKEKKPKPPKPKKEKKPKDPGPPEKRLPKKKVIAVAIFFTSFLAAVTFCTFAFANIGYESAAKTNYQKGDYKGAYESLNGLDHISAESQDIYNRAYVLMRLQRRLDAYNEFEQRGDSLGAIDSLIQGVQIRDGLTEYAASLEVGSQFEEIYQEILNTLSGMFGVDETRARELYDISDKVQYTMALMDVTDPGWRDEIQPTVELTEGGAGIEFAEDGLTVDNAAHRQDTGEGEQTGDDGQTDAEIPDMSEEAWHPEEDTGFPSGDGTDTGGNGQTGNTDGITLTPDSDTVIIPEGAQLQVTPNNNNPSGGNNNGNNNGQTLYQFNVTKDANGNYVQQ